MFAGTLDRRRALLVEALARVTRIPDDHPVIADLGPAARATHTVR